MSIYDQFIGTVSQGISNPYGLAAVAATGKHESGMPMANGRTRLKAALPVKRAASSHGATNALPIFDVLPRLGVIIRTALRRRHRPSSSFRRTRRSFNG